MNKPSFLHSLAGRLLLFGAMPALLAVTTVVALAAMDGWRQLRSVEERTLLVQAIGTASELNVRNERWNDVAATIGMAQASGMFGQRRETLEHLRLVVEAFPVIAGAFVSYEPNADGLDAKPAAALPPASMDAAGRFLPYWFRDPARGGEIALKPNAGMETLEYYLGPKGEFSRGGKATPFLTEPYLYEGVKMVTHSFPIVRDGRFVGVAGVDRALTSLDTILGQFRGVWGVDVFVVAHDGKFIAASTGTAQEGVALGDTLVSKSVYSALASQFDASHGDRVFLAADPVLGERCFYAVAKIPTGRWTVVLRRPEAVVLADANSSMRRNVALGIGAIVAITALMLLAARAITSRVARAVAVADRIAAGDLTQRDDWASGRVSKDETGQLVAAMGTMSHNLNGLVGSVKQQSIALNSTATEMAATAKQQEASASSFGAASSQIAAAVREISATGQDLVRTMDGVHADALETAKLAGSGRRGLQGMESVMRDLDRATSSVADKLAAINDRSQKITTVVTTITKVADQTNILSINAAIEAEKAGEFGSGFLVIAREIRRLADQTAGATLDIEQMVQQMQAAVSAGVMEMDRFADQVRRGVQDVAAVGAQLGEIIERVNRSTESFRSVNESMQSQSQGAEQISDGMAQLTANATQTMQSIHEFGRAADDLQNAIGLLRQAVAKFHLAE